MIIDDDLFKAVVFSSGLACFPLMPLKRFRDIFMLMVFDFKSLIGTPGPLQNA